MEHNDKPQTVPYVSFLTLKNFIDSCAESTVPTRVDRHVLSSLSGANQTALLSALRFLELTDDGGQVQESLRDVVSARRKGGEDWHEALANLLDEAYGDILGDFDVMRGVLTELEDKLAAAGVKKGGMMSKTVRFYVRGMKEGGIDVSQHVTKPRKPGRRKGATAKTSAKRSKRSGGGTIESSTKMHPPAVDATPEGFARQQIPTMPGAYIQYKLDMAESDLALFDAALAFVKAVTQRGGKK